MRKQLTYALAYITLSFFTSCLFIACQSSEKAVEKQAPISEEVLIRIGKLGFGTGQVVKTEGGYIVEGDIFLSDADISKAPASPALDVADSEQYRTFNLVSVPSTGTRTIRIALSGLPTVYSDATNIAIDRYNDLNLRIRFLRVTSSPNITLVGFDQGPSSDGFITLGSAGFPTSAGNPHNQIRMNVNQAAYGSNPDVDYLASVIQHEIGHCIGFRHTDYANRSYSCGNYGGPYNEGSGSVGAIRIPGTPRGADPNSWMLACSNGGDRTFNANDIIALDYLY